ncbi:MAG: glycosyltransferase [Sedimentisphaerales bacterium]|nr:glycosyltransferase [Sedimentisphaerales bacterium]
MANKNAKKVAFIATYPPRRCGIATFTSDLITSVSACAGPPFEPLVVAMQSDSPCQYPSSVKFEIRTQVKNDYICAADYLNFSHVDLISVQHEYGIFGGPAGGYLSLLLRRVNAPIVTTLHTVLADPADEYRKATLDLCDLSDCLVVMNERGITMLDQVYGVNTDKIVLIPHGIPDLPFVDSSYYKHRFGIEGRKTILTFGLLSRNKGIETMLDALPEIVRADPSVLYIILGATHPAVLQHEGEAYRFSLQQRIGELGLDKHVLFHNRFVSDDRLRDFLCAADIYVTPYRSREQLTSGTLAFAVGAGKAVVSTRYWAAEELLREGRGKLVAFDNPRSLAKAVIALLRNENRFHAMRRKAYDYSRRRTWPEIGKEYWKLFQAQTPIAEKLARQNTTSAREPLSLKDLPECSLEHIQRLTDDTGLFQHARSMIPDRNHGYCTDDNARALVAMVKHYGQFTDPQALRLFDTYLSFLHYAQDANGLIRNFLGYDRRWWAEEPAHDALGRTLWAFGAVMSQPPAPRYVPLVKDCFDRSVCHVPLLSPRGKAYSIFGMAEYLKQFPGASDIKRYFLLAADFLADSFRRTESPTWPWFEEVLSYDNAVLPHAMYTAARITGDSGYVDIAEKSCRFLLDNTSINGQFRFIGCNGWYPKGGNRAVFGQQPIEAAGTVMLLRAVYDATGNVSMLTLQRLAFDWFLGRNDLHTSLYDFQTKGCSDGLERTGISLNQGAESMVSFLLSLLSVVESSHLFDETLTEKKTASVPQSAGLPRKINELPPLVASRRASSKKKESFSGRPDNR